MARSRLIPFLNRFVLPAKVGIQSATEPQIFVLPAKAGIQSVREPQMFVLPAKAGIQSVTEPLDTRFRGYDEGNRF